MSCKHVFIYALYLKDLIPKGTGVLRPDDVTIALGSAVCLFKQRGWIQAGTADTNMICLTSTHLNCQAIFPWKVYQSMHINISIIHTSSIICRFFHVKTSKKEKSLFGAHNNFGVLCGRTNRRLGRRTGMLCSCEVCIIMLSY